MTKQELILHLKDRIAYTHKVRQARDDDFSVRHNVAKSVCSALEDHAVMASCERIVAITRHVIETAINGAEGIPATCEGYADLAVTST